MALMSAAGAPIAPASPQPFTPSGLCVHGVSRVSTYAYVNPVVAIVLGAVLLQESIDLTMIVGAAVILVSVGLVIRTEARANRAARELPAGAAEANPAAG